MAGLWLPLPCIHLLGCLHSYIDAANRPCARADLEVAAYLVSMCLLCWMMIECGYIARQHVLNT